MKAGNFVELEFIVKGEIQCELTNVEHISRFFFADNRPFIGMLGQTFTRQLSHASYDKLVNHLNISEL